MKHYSNELRLQAAFENACDCLYYGYGRQYWNDCGLPKKEADKVWKEAHRYLGNKD